MNFSVNSQKSKLFFWIDEAKGTQTLQKEQKSRYLKM